MAVWSPVITDIFHKMLSGVIDVHRISSVFTILVQMSSGVIDVQRMSSMWMTSSLPTPNEVGLEMSSNVNDVQQMSSNIIDVLNTPLFFPSERGS